MLTFTVEVTLLSVETQPVVKDPLLKFACVWLVLKPSAICALCTDSVLALTVELKMLTLRFAK